MCCVVWKVSIASSAIIGTAGQALQISPPLSAVYGALPGPPAFCWDEQSGITTTGMTVNTIENGFYTAPALFQSQYTVTGNQLHFDLWVGGASWPVGRPFWALGSSLSNAPVERPFFNWSWIGA